MPKPLDFKRLMAVANLMESDVEGERANALAIANRMLAAAGLHWADVLRAPAAEHDAEVLRPGGGMPGFADIFADFTKSWNDRQHAKPEPQPRRKRRETLAGADIPASIGGLVRILGRHPTRKGEMMDVMIVGDDADYGPLRVFDADDIAYLAAADDRPVHGTARQPAAAGKPWPPTFHPSRNR